MDSPAGLEEDYSFFEIGYIPKNWDGEYICNGDPEGSNTVGVYFEIYDSQILFNKEKESFFFDDGWFDPKSELWKAIAAKASKYIDSEGAKLDPKKLGKAWAFFLEEEHLFKGATYVVGPEDGGEFNNSDHRFNGYFYLSYFSYSDGECFEERTIVFK
jgi:hypothetical protein